MKIRAAKNSLGFQLVAIILLSFMVPTMVLAFFTSTVLFRSLESKTEATMKAGLEHAAQLTMNNIDRIITLAKDVTYDGTITRATANYESGEIARYDDYYMVVRAYLDPKFGREAMVQFTAFYRLQAPESLIIGRLGQSASTAGQAEIFATQSLQSVQDITQELDTNVYFYQNEGFTYLVRNLYNMRLNRFGVLVLGVDMSQLLAPIYAEAKKWDGELHMALSGYATEGAPDFAFLETGISNELDSVSLTEKIKGKDLTLNYRLTLNRQELYKELTAFRQLLIVLLLLLIPILTVSMIFIRRRILKPVSLLSAAAKQIEKGQWGVTVPMRGEDELGVLGRSFSNMSVQLKDLIETSYLKEIALRDAKIDAIQRRINPHFINNALETINWQARMDNAQKVSEMVEALSVLLNAAMDRDNERLVPLNQEMEIANAYFYFLSLHYGDRLTIDRRMEEDTLSFPVPRLMIQTLLENANEHGIALGGGGHIVLNVFRRYEHLVIEVINTGQRLTDDDLTRIREIIGNTDAISGRLGLATISQRLRLLYDGRSSIGVSKGAQGETVFTVTLPFA